MRNQQDSRLLLGGSGVVSALAALALLVTMTVAFASVGTAQISYRQVGVEVLPPSQGNANGSWKSVRDDAEAQATGEAGVIRSGSVDVLAAAGPDAKANALKLRQAGVIQAPDDPRGWAVGAEWDYHHPIIAALANVGHILPENPDRPQDWANADQDLYEFGRTLIPYLRARTHLERMISTTLGRGFERHVLLWVLANAPDALPEVPNADDPDRIKPFDGSRPLLAALRLGPGVLVGLEALEAELGESMDDKIRAWAGFIRREVRVLERGITRVLAGLRPEFALSGDNRTRWPEADRAVVEQFSLSSLGLLETLSASDGTFAPKADYLHRWARREAASDLANRLERLALLDLLPNDYFEQGVVPPPGAVGSVPFGAFGQAMFGDDLLVFLLCQEFMGMESTRLSDEAKVLDLSVDPESKKLAAAKRAVAAIIEASVNRLLDPLRGDMARRFAENARSAPQDAVQLVAQAAERVRDLPLTAMGEVLRQRTLATAFETKINFMRERVQAPDQQAASDLFEVGARKHAATADLSFSDGDFAELRRTGRLLMDERRADALRLSQDDMQRLVARGFLDATVRADGTTAIWFTGHPSYRRLARLTDADFRELQSRRQILIEPGVVFRGVESGDGRVYDFQRDVPNKGLSINLTPPLLGPKIPFDLEPGRTYSFSFKYMTRGLSGQATWVRIVPLDADGRPEAQTTGWTANDDLEAGVFVPFDFARYNADGSMESPRYVGTVNEWQTARFQFSRVPDPVRGFAIEIKVDQLTGAGAIWYKDFRLELKRDFFREDFEPDPFRPEPASGPGGRPVLTPVWSLIHDHDRRLMPAYSGLSYTTVNLPEGSSRALLLEPRGFNMRIESDELFEFRSNRHYKFRGSMHTENMGTMRAWFEVLLYDGQRRPVTPDGILCAEGENVLRTPARGDRMRNIGLGNLLVPAGWVTDSLHFDELDREELAAQRGRGELAAADTRERHTIRFARIAIVADGPAREHSARIGVDNIEILEYPKVSIVLGQQMLKRESSLVPSEREWEEPHGLGSVMVRPAPPQDPDRFRLFIEVSVAGLAPRRIGYHYKLTLRDYLGNVVPALDLLGAGRLDRIVHSDHNGNIGSEEFNRIFLHDLDLKNRFGYFSAEFTLRYLDSQEPLYSREFLIGFVPPALNTGDPSRAGDFGVILDDSSTRMARLGPALQMLGVGRVAWPLFRTDSSGDPGDYSAHSFLADQRVLMNTLPHLRHTAILGPLPTEIETATAVTGAGRVFADPVRREWRDLLKAVHGTWREKFDEQIAGSPDDESFAEFTSDAAMAMDHLGVEFASNLLDFTPRGFPVTLGSGQSQTDRVDSVVRSFSRRWQRALDAQSQEVRDAIATALDARTNQRLREASPPAIWLRDREFITFRVPASLSAADMEAAAAAYLSRIGRFASVLGTDSATAVQNAQAAASGAGFDPTTFGADLANPARHVFVIDLLAVDPTQDIGYADQLRDLTEKLVTAKRLGYGRVFLSRLRDSGDLPDGLLTRDNLARPAFYAFRTLNSVLSNADIIPLQLELESGAKHHFFRDRSTGELTFFMLPGSQDIREHLPFGNTVRQVDMMGNPRVLSFDAVHGGTPGTVAAEVRADGIPLILSGIDARLLETVLSVGLDNPVIRATENAQPQRITITNNFDVPVTIGIRIPLDPNSADTDNIIRDVRMLDASGNEVGERAKDFSFQNMQLAPGQVASFDFQLKPRPSMKVGARVIPVELNIKGGYEFKVSRRMPVTVDSLVDVTQIDLVNPEDGGGYELSMKVQNTTDRQQAFRAAVYLPERAGVRPVTRDFSLTANGEGNVTRRLPPIDPAEMDGLLIRLNISQSPSWMFYNQDYRVKYDRLTNTLRLVAEQAAR